MGETIWPYHYFISTTSFYLQYYFVWRLTVFFFSMLWYSYKCWYFVVFKLYFTWGTFAFGEAILRGSWQCGGQSFLHCDLNYKQDSATSFRSRILNRVKFHFFSFFIIVVHKGASLPGILFLNRVVMLTLLLENNRNQNVVSTSFVSRHMIVRFAHLNVVPAMCTRSLYTGAWMLTKLYRNHAQKCAKLNNLFFPKLVKQYWGQLFFFPVGEVQAHNIKGVTPSTVQNKFVSISICWF